jgi:sugar lactone lactonase YvrE
VDAKGRAFVGDFGFDLPGELVAHGIEKVLADHPTAKLACVSADGVAREVARDMHFPNGSVITPDGTTLIVAETIAERLTSFDIGADGSLTNRRVWASLCPHLPRESAQLFAKPAGAAFHCFPDAIALNSDGQIWIANALAPECVLVAEGGRILEVIDTGVPCFGCMLGGDDGKTLFMLTSPPTAGPDSPKSKLIIATVDVPHAGLP